MIGQRADAPREKQGIQRRGGQLVEGQPAEEVDVAVAVGPRKGVGAMGQRVIGAFCEKVQALLVNALAGGLQVKEALIQPQRAQDARIDLQFFAQFAKQSMLHGFVQPDAAAGQVVVAVRRIAHDEQVVVSKQQGCDAHVVAAVVGVKGQIHGNHFPYSKILFN